MPKHVPPLPVIASSFARGKFGFSVSSFAQLPATTLPQTSAYFTHRILGKILLRPQAHRLLRSFLQIPLPCHLHRAPSPCHTPSARLWPHHCIHWQRLLRPIQYYALHSITTHSRTPRYFRHATCAQALSAQHSQADIALPALHNPSALILSPAHAPPLPLPTNALTWTLLVAHSASPLLTPRHMRAGLCAPFCTILPSASPLAHCKFAPAWVISRPCKNLATHHPVPATRRAL